MVIRLRSVVIIRFSSLAMAIYKMTYNDNGCPLCIKSCL